MFTYSLISQSDDSLVIALGTTTREPTEWTSTTVNTADRLAVAFFNGPTERREDRGHDDRTGPLVYRQTDRSGWVRVH